MSLGHIIYVLNLVVANLLLGFALALLLGHGPQRWPHVGRWPRLRWFRRRRDTAVETAAPAAVPVAAAPVAAVSAVEIAKAPAPAVQQQQSSPAATTTAAAVSPAANTNTSTVFTPTQDPAPSAAPLKHAAPPDGFGDLNWALPLDAVLAQFQSESHQARGELAALTERARQCGAAPSASEISACVAELQEVSQRHLTQQDGTLAMLEDTLAGDDEEHADLGESVRQAACEQGDVLRSTLQQLATWPANIDLHEQSRQLVAQTERVLAACNRMDECVDRAAVQLQSRQMPGAETAYSQAQTVEIPSPPIFEGPQLETALTVNSDHTNGDELASDAMSQMHEDALLAAVARSLAEVGALREDATTKSKLATSQ